MRVRAIIISNAGRLLLGLNQDDQYMLPGGKIKESEHPVDALLREVYEETGLNTYDSLEYLWLYLGNHVFIYVPEDTTRQPTCANDPSSEFKSLEWFNLEALPSNLDSYSEDIIYHFLRVEILQKGKENTMKVTSASHIDVLVDGKKAFQLDDDTIWLTLPRLAQERSKGKKIQFKQVNEKGEVIDQDAVPNPISNEKCLKCQGMGCRCGGKCKECIDHENGKHSKKIKSCLKDMDLVQYNKCILFDMDSELLNPSVEVLKVADTFDNSLLFDGKDEFWITNCCKPIWRSNYLNRYASYDDVVEKWNQTYPNFVIDLDWFKDLLKKMMESKKDKVKKKSK